MIVMNTQIPLLYKRLTFIWLLACKYCPQYYGKAVHVRLLRGPGVDVIQVLGRHVVEGAIVFLRETVLFPLLIVFLFSQLTPRLKGCSAKVSYLQVTKSMGLFYEDGKQIGFVLKFGGKVNVPEIVAVDSVKIATSEQTQKLCISSVI